MCGLFGAIRANTSQVSYKAALASGDSTSLAIAAESRAARAFYWLGRLAVSRGADAAGLAAFTGRTNRHPATPAPSPASLNENQNRHKNTSHLSASSPSLSLTTPTGQGWNQKKRNRVDGWRIYKDTQSFARLWETSIMPTAATSFAGLTPTIQSQTQLTPAPVPLIEGAKVLLGHTRQASPTVRGLEDLANASPLVVGNLLGTHNGGVNIRQLLDQFGLTPAANMEGRTSSEAILRCLDKNVADSLAHDHDHVQASSSSGFGRTQLEALVLPEPEPELAMMLDRITDVLEAMRGRAALAWVDRNHPIRVYLARAALSPLATARDVEGNFYWASAPEWFELLDQYSGGFFGFTEITPLEEGTLLVVEARPNDVPQVLIQRRFRPVARPADFRLRVY